VNSFRKELDARLHSSEEGVSLVEVLIAMLIFTIVSLGVIGTLIATSNFANDSRSRETAVNLASQYIDSARATADVFGLHGVGPLTTAVGGTTYTVTEVAQWVSNPTSVAPCGGGGGALQYKRVNVQVTWPGNVSPVEQDTLIAPATRVSDPNDATILISVVNQANQPVSGVTITTTPALSPAAAPTDVDGCTYLLKVPVGTYVIKATKASYISPSLGSPPVQYTTQTQTQTVTAGTSISAPFVMDVSTPLPITYASNSLTPVSLPVSMYTSLMHASDLSLDGGSDTGAIAKPLAMYPYTDGYSVYAGHFIAAIAGNAGCQDPNPALWLPSTVLGVGYASPAVSPTPAGGTASVRMGLVTVKGTSGGQNVSALQVGAATGADPGCALATTTSTVYNFGPILSSNVSTTLALPFGTYKLYYTTTGSGSAVAATNITVIAPSLKSTTVSNQVTLDPRVVTP
jgi:type II secretory pathway pseudopilin PulG